MYVPMGFIPLFTPAKLSYFLSLYAGGWSLADRPEAPRLHREAIRGFPESTYGADLYFPEAEELVSHWPLADGGPTRLDAESIDRLLQEILGGG
jgi:hypothetical protein